MRHGLGMLVLAFGVATPVAVAQSLETSQHRDVDVQALSRLNDANTRLKRAWSSFEKRDFAGARAEAAKCLELVPALPEGHLLLAKAAYVEKDFPEVLAEIEAAKAGHEKTAALRERMDQYRRADLRKRMRVLDNEISDLRAQAARQGSGTRLAAAESERARLQELESAPADWDVEVPAEYDFLHGNVLMRLGRYDVAVAQYGEALRKKPAYVEAANNLASVHHGKRQYGKALEVVQKAETAGARLNPELKRAIEEGLAKSP